MKRSLNPCPSRAGFTLVELLVVIAIIGVLVALLLPAVQAARESSRQAACANKLKQLALAAHNHDSQKRELPYSTRPLTGPGRISWEIRVLPYLEQSGLYNQYDLNLSWSDTTIPASGSGSPKTLSNSQIVTTYLPVFTCPSTPQPERQDIDPDSATAALKVLTTLSNYSQSAATDYSPTIGVDIRLYNAGLVDQYGDGAMPKNKVSHLADIHDGLSNTILFGESAGRPFLYQLGRQIGDLTTNRVNGGGWGRPASDYSIDGSSYDGTTLVGPCAVNCTNGEDFQSYPITYYAKEGTGETYAFHPAGAYHAFADASVKLISKNINIRTYAKLVTRAKADPIVTSTTVTYPDKDVPDGL